MNGTEPDSTSAKADTPRTDIRMSRADAIALTAIVLRLRSIPHFNRRFDAIESMPSWNGSCAWAIVLNEIIDRLQTDQALSELWVWSRFCWAFGKRNTWEAARNFQGLLDLVKMTTESMLRLTRLHWYQWSERISERKHLHKLYASMGHCLGALYTNDCNWNDLESYRRFERTH